ncbi:hypothetical protein [Helicobacter heilmannii]|uniref:Uncharacterized protein n=1 Tax=Helicobacter heilmannii TaxID=35817 RepID=A0A0K2YD22_HELHE|nr:hypothetical protein [Helicobacter heilmannii]BDQ26478.1 hypothetical protein ASB1_01540 [Helicobacter heilmannii]CCM11458.1 hypothetical protein BN341_12860 [Helicobacter heilmannii ASB1.4]CRI34880.1 hypothetical protein HHE01_06810 [Helicobacter heilmannii]
MIEQNQNLEQVYMSHYAKDLAFENLVKNFSFFVVFVVVAVVSVSLWLYPEINDYRSQDTNARQQTMIVAYKRKDFVSAIQTYHTIKEKNGRLLQHPDYSAITHDLNVLLKKHFTHIKIQEQSHRIDTFGRFIYGELKVSAHARNLKDFYTFFNGLAAISVHMQVELPITITKNRDTFALDFIVHVDYKAMDH